MIRTVMFVAMGGAAGSVLRYLTSVFANRYFQGYFPLATFIANAIGCLLIGLLMGFFIKNNLGNSDLKWLLVTGFCGGYTTFSAFALENVSLFQSQQYATAFFYIAASIAVGLAGVWCGLVISRLFI